MLWYFSCIHKAFLDNDYTLECATIVKEKKKREKKRMKRKEVTSLKSHKYVYIYTKYQCLSPLKRPKNSQVLCCIWTRKVRNKC